MPKRNPETDLQSAIREALAYEHGLVLWRNNTGAVYKNGRLIEYGLAEGSADLIGCLAPHGRLISLEVKVPGGKLSQAQVDWMALINRLGGYACEVYSVEEARAAIREARRMDPS